MSEEKDLGDKAKDAFDKAKEEAKETFEEVKDDVKNTYEKVKEEAKEFTQEAKQTFDSSNPDGGKNIAIIAHFTLIGWIIAMVMNSSNKSEYASFYIRQTLGLFLFSLVVGFIPFINLIAFLVLFVFWLMSLINCLNGKTQPIAVVGDMFQNWFKGI